LAHQGVTDADISSDHLRRPVPDLRLADGRNNPGRNRQSARREPRDREPGTRQEHGGQRGYRFQQVQRTAQARPQQVRHQPRKLTLRVRRAIARKLRKERWSPEQMSFWLRAERGVAFSHEWIYRMIWDNKRAGGDLWRFLRRRGKHYTRRGAQHAGRGVIPHRIDIAERPAIVAAKTRLGDWEGATIVGAQRKGALLTHVERTRLFTTSRNCLVQPPRPRTAPRCIG
jgi:IS30 family transposase